MRWTIALLLIVAISSPAMAATAATPSGRLELKADPTDLRIGTFFSGADLQITGHAPQGQDVVIEILGPEVDEVFDVKGRVGPFWMTCDRAEIDQAPSIYALLLPRQVELGRQSESIGFGFTQLRKNVSLRPGKKSANQIFQMFLKLKQKEGLYTLNGNTVHYTDTPDGGRDFKATFRFSRSTPAGIYTIRATAVAGGRKVAADTLFFPVQEVGFVHLIDDLATERRLLYGVMAVVVAIFAGTVMGIVFKGGASH